MLVGSKIRARVGVHEATEVQPGSLYQIITKVTIEREGSDKPCCMAEVFKTSIMHLHILYGV